ncbi:MAG: hypothetical protein AMXMBFR74_16950 [Parvibaculum sp.]
MRLLASADLCETSKGAAPSFLHLTAIGQLGDGFYHFSPRAVTAASHIRHRWAWLPHRKLLSCA